MATEHNSCCGSHEVPKDRSTSTGSHQTTFRVSGMDCPDEIAAIERALKPINGILSVEANLMSSTVTIHHDGATSEDALATAVNTAGVTVQEDDTSTASKQPSRLSGMNLMLVCASGAFTGIGLLSDWLKIAVVPQITFLAAIACGAYLILPKALRSMKSAVLDMNTLMVVAVTGAVAIGEYAEGAAVVCLFALSELLESWSVDRARRAIRALMDLAPEVALVKRNGSVTEVSANRVLPGETILVKAGQRVPLDGNVELGASTVNQAPITGESMPVEKKPGDPVYAGTINGDGSLEVKTTKAASDTTLARIIKMVEQAQQQKAPSQRFVDVFAKYYTPAVFILALLLGIIPPLFFNQAWMEWIYKALVLLVIACPCALVISTPVTIVSGLTAMAKRGVLIKGGVYLEALGKLRALAVDKTGTITEGHPKVIQVTPLGNQDAAFIVGIAASIDTHSTHPLAQAVVAYAEENAISYKSAIDYQSKTGRGAQASIDGHLYFVGNHRFAHELGICSPEVEKILADIESKALSVVVVGHQPHANCSGEVLGVLAIGDRIRANAAQAIQRLHKSGIAKVVMLSGDNARTAAAIGEQVGVDEAQGDLLPADKIERVKALTEEFTFVGMIGDGVNDAPALAAATVGIAMGTAGTDTAIETADVALMKDDLMMVSEAISLGRRTLAVIRFNIIFALGIKAIFLFLALSGHASLWLAVLADTGATLLVAANALRLLKSAAAP